MLRNNNGKFIRTLSASCLKANKLRNLIAIFAIVLTTVLFTSVATVMEGSMQSIKDQLLRQSGSKFMLSVKYLTGEDCGRIAADPAFSETGVMQYLGRVQNEVLNKLEADLCWADESYLDGTFVKAETGRLPESADEILMDASALRLLGIPEQIGETVTLDYEVNGELRQRTMTLAGIYSGATGENHTSIFVSKIFMDKELENIPVTTGGTMCAGSYILGGSFLSSENLAGKRREVLLNAGFNPDALPNEDGYVVAAVSDAYGSSMSMDPGVVLGAGVMIIVIIFAGYLIISNVFRISVMKDMRMYGQLKTVGTSPKQLRRLLRRQANFLNLIGIPIGLVLGYLLGLVLLPVVMKATIYTDVQSLRPRLWVFVMAAVFAFVTVWISSNKPAKMMSKMSPIQALRYGGDEDSGRKQARGRESKARILQMAVSNIISNKRKTFLAVLSLSLSVLLFNSILNFTDSFDEKTYVEGQSGADFIVSNASFGTGTESERYVLDREFLDAIQKRTDIKSNGAVYCYQASDDMGDESAQHYDGIRTVKINTVNGAPYPDARAMELGKMLYGFEPQLFGRCKVVRGVLDMDKLASGKYIVEATTFINNNKDYDADAFSLMPGDKVRGEIGGIVLEYEVLANVVIPYDLLYSSSMGEAASLVLPAEEYLRQFPETMPIHYVMDAKENCFEDVDQFLKMYENQPQANISFSSRETVRAAFGVYKNTFSTTGLVLAVIFGIIGLLNLLNVTLTNAITRQREFAIMQSIGMTRRQLRRLFVLEGILYTVIADILSLVLAALLSVSAVRALTGAYWFCNYHFTVLPAAGLIPVFIVVAGAIALIIDRIWNGGSVVERLRVSK